MFKHGVSKVHYHLTRAQRRITIEVFENMGTALVKRWLQHRPHCDWWTDCHFKFKLWVSAKSHAAFSALVLESSTSPAQGFSPLSAWKNSIRKECRFEELVFCSFLLACWLQGDMSWQSVFLPLQVLLFASARKKLLEIIYHDVGMLSIQCKSWDDLCLLESSVALDTASWDRQLHYSQIVLNVIGLSFGISHWSWNWESLKLTSGSVMLPVTGQAVWNTPSWCLLLTSSSAENKIR